MSTAIDLCNAITSDGHSCHHIAGQGTNHRGNGHCYLHEGEGNAPKPRLGYVYLIKPIGHNVYKIGCTTDCTRRFKTMRNTYPFKFECVGKNYYKDYEYAERYWHEYFKNRKLQGEWFLLSDHDVQTFLGDES